jgi:hypothetical protein
VYGLDHGQHLLSHRAFFALIEKALLDTLSMVPIIQITAAPYYLILVML